MVETGSDLKLMLMLTEVGIIFLVEVWKWPNEALAKSGDL